MQDIILKVWVISLPVTILVSMVSVWSDCLMMRRSSSYSTKPLPSLIQAFRLTGVGMLGVGMLEVVRRGGLRFLKLSLLGWQLPLDS